MHVLSISLLTLIAVSAQAQIKDSTAFYTLKANETMVLEDEHGFRDYSSGQEYVFATEVKGIGFFIRTSTGKVFGPYAKLGPGRLGDHSEVYRGSRMFILNVRLRTETGPFNYENNPEYYCQWSNVAYVPSFVMAEQTTSEKKYAINVNGKIFKTAIPLDNPLGYFELKLWDRGDKLVVEYWMSSYTKEGKFYRDSVVVMTNVVRPKPAPLPEFEVKGSDSLFVDGNFYAVIQPVYTDYGDLSDGWQYDEVSKNIIHTGYKGDSLVTYVNKQPVVTTEKEKYKTAYASQNLIQLSGDSDWFIYLVKEKKIVRTTNYILFSTSQKDYAEDMEGTILINGKHVGTGYSLTYEAQKNRFVWVSVWGRSLYLNSYLCR